MTKDQINEWVRRHDVKVLFGEGGVGLAREWCDFPSANNRRHLIVVDHKCTHASTEAAVRKFCKMHKLPLP